MRPAASLVVLLVTVPLAGCIGGDGDREEALPATGPARASVTAGAGGVEGIVTDNAVQPVPGATVTVAGIGGSATTRDDGSYAVSDVPPGPHVVTVEAPGYVPAAQTVEVAAGEVVVADFVLVHLQSDLPYVQALELEGYIECSVVVGVSPVFTGSIGSCAPETLPNSTNHRVVHRFRLDPPVGTLVVETVWAPSGATGGDALRVDLEIDGDWGGVTVCPGRCVWDVSGNFSGIGGPSPLRQRFEQERLQTVQDNFTEACDDGGDMYCGYSFFDEGWPLEITVWPSPVCRPVPVILCMPLQQPYTHYVTAFYNGRAPPGFTGVPS